MKVKFRKLCLAVLAVFLLGILAGCGLKGDPRPDFDRDSFSFGEISAVLAADGTVTVSGSLDGAFQNMHFLVLEMQPVDGELCKGCPFVPQDQFRIDARDAWESENGSRFSVVYRPIFAADMYRWRLIGHNIYSGIGAVVSPLQVVDFESSYLEQNVPAPAKAK